jgi:sugar phosphate isomerase/epimerase
MANNTKPSKVLPRRKFLGLTAAASALTVLPGKLLTGTNMLSFHDSRPDSLFGGVQVGTITYSWRSMARQDVSAILEYCIETGISSIEWQGYAAEAFAGIPSMPARPEGWDNLSDTEKNAWQQEAGKVREARKEWRIAAPMNKFEELRKIYNDAGVKIHILKFEPADWSDQELDYAFKVAKALGASGVSDEIGENSARRMGKFAEKHGMFAIFHQHEQPGQPGWSFDKFLAYSPANMLSFDAGHYFGATGLHPNGVIERLHKRIANVHIKDKTGPKSNPPDTNMPWGKGETPIADVLLLIRKNKWPINVDIELEYPVPEGSDAVKEVKKCVEYCKSILST